MIGADLADWTAIAPGHRMTVEAYGVSRTFTIDRVVPRLGVAGLAPLTQSFGSLSLNLFVPPGTIESMLREAHDVTGQAQPVSVLAISNGNRRPFDPRESAAVSARLRATVKGLPAQVQPVKQLLLADADSRGRRFTGLFRAFGIFSVFGGILLIILSVLMLVARPRPVPGDPARQRAPAERAGRRALARGLAVRRHRRGRRRARGRRHRGARREPRSQPVPDPDHRPGRPRVRGAARRASLSGCAIGFLAALAVVASAAVVVSRRNIVRMIKGVADPPRALVASSRTLVGGALVAAGVVTLAAGLETHNGVAGVVGPAIGGVGIVMLVAPRSTRLVVSLVAVAVFVWSALVITVVRDSFTGLSVALITAEGVVLSACARSRW